MKSRLAKNQSKVEEIWSWSSPAYLPLNKTLNVYQLLGQFYAVCTRSRTVSFLSSLFINKVSEVLKLHKSYRNYIISHSTH